MDADLGFRLAAFVFLMLCSAGFSASETALFSLPRPRARAMRRQGGAGARISGLLERPRRLITSILMGNEIVNIAASALFTGAVVAHLPPGGRWLAPALMTPLLMVFGEITPKSLAARHPERFSRLLAYPVSAFAIVVSPLRWVFLQMANGVLSCMGAPPRDPQSILMEDEFLHLVDAGHAEGELEEGERELIHNVFGFHDRTAADVAAPRTDLECWEIGLPVAEAIARVRAATHSRIPVFEGDRDRIVGVLYVKDFLRQAGRKRFGPEERLEKRMLRAPLVVPGGMKLDRLFRRFRHERTHLAIVQDEFGGTLGLVTMTDLLEEIFGEIKDEHGEVEEAWIEREEEDSYLCQGRVPLAEFSEASGWELPAYEEANTLGGAVFTMLGRVPSPNESVRLGSVELTVTETSGSRVLRVRARRREDA